MNLLTDPVISATLACALSLLLALAGAHKLRAPDEFRATLEAYAILPVGSTGIATRLLPLFELAIAIALLHPQWRAHAACGAAALLGVHVNKFKRWGYRIDGLFSAKAYATKDEAKLALFDEFWATTQDDDRLWSSD